MSISPSLQTADKTFRDDVLVDLGKPQKVLRPKYFYDERGSELFDQITEQPEYYPTRTELAIMQRHGAAIAEAIGPEALLIELGGGSLLKVRELLKHLKKLCGYVTIDVSGEHQEQAVRDLQVEFPNLEVETVCADFTQPIELPPMNCEPKTRVAYFPGSTIGNFDPRDRLKLLRNIAKLLGVGGTLIVGADLKKNLATLEAAYNDAADVTAAFNKNILHRINAELEGNFDLDAFEHYAFYNEKLSRIEMHLRSLKDQQVTVSGQQFHFRRGETIHTENSHKQDIESLSKLVAEAGFALKQVWTDPSNLFGVFQLDVVTL